MNTLQKSVWNLDEIKKVSSQHNPFKNKKTSQNWMKILYTFQIYEISEFELPLDPFLNKIAK